MLNCYLMGFNLTEYSELYWQEAFSLIVRTLSSLNEINSPSFGRSTAILETLAKYRSCVVMLDLECNNLVTEVFTTFLSVARYFQSPPEFDSIIRSFFG